MRIRELAENTKGKQIRIKLTEYILQLYEKGLPIAAINGLRLCIDLYAINSLNMGLLKEEAPEIFGIRAKDYNRNRDLIEYVL